MTKRLEDLVCFSLSLFVLSLNYYADQLHEERAREFMLEGLRWHDLVRTEKVLDVMNAWEKLDDTSGKIVGVDAKDIIYPIHQSQLDVKDGLYEQNLGY